MSQGQGLILVLLRQQTPTKWDYFSHLEGSASLAPVQQIISDHQFHALGYIDCTMPTAKVTHFVFISRKKISFDSLFQ